MSTVNPFAPAVRQQMKARVAFDGPTGSGKTWTALQWATVLAEGERIAVIDTEHGSAALYSDVYDFDTVKFTPPYDPARLVKLLGIAAANGYGVVIIDSLSHFWEGEGGTLDIADSAGQRSGGNSFAGWKVATPALRHLIDTILAHPAHVLSTMRSKMEYVLERDERTGKTAPKKVGMAPVMRNGVEYEFTLVADLDLEHRLVISKSRCSALADHVVQPGRADEAAKVFRDWLDSGSPPPEADAEIVSGPGSRSSFPGEGDAAPDDHPVGGGDPTGTEEPSGVNGGRHLAAEADPPAPAESPKARFWAQLKEMDADGDEGKPLRHAVIHKATDGATENSQKAGDDALEAACELLTQFVEGTWRLDGERLVSGSAWLEAQRENDAAGGRERLRELVGLVDGLGEARVLKRAQRIAKDEGLMVPDSFDDIEGAVLARVVSEAEAKLAEQEGAA